MHNTQNLVTRIEKTKVIHEHDKYKPGMIVKSFRSEQYAMIGYHPEHGLMLCFLADGRMHSLAAALASSDNNFIPQQDCMFQLDLPPALPASFSGVMSDVLREANG